MPIVGIRLEVDETVRDDFDEVVDHCIDFNTRTAFFPPMNRRILEEARRIGRFHPAQIYILNHYEQELVNELRHRALNGGAHADKAQEVTTG